MEDTAIKKNKRKRYIEYLRCVAMFCVVLIHICTTARTDFVNHTPSEEVLVKSITNVFHFAVPVFFMITGALFLRPEKKITIENLLKKYTLKYALGILVFGWAFAFMELLFEGRNNLPGKLLTSFVRMLEGQTWNHMWYLYTLVGIMLTMPIWKMVVQVCEEENNRKMLYYVLICIFTFTSVIDFIGKTTGLEIAIVFPVSVTYVGYLFLGYIIDKGYFVIKKNVSAIVGIVSAVLIIISEYASTVHNIGWAEAVGKYSSPIILILSTCIFSYFKQSVDNDKEVSENSVFQKCVKHISGCSYGVYIVHMLVINLVYKLAKVSPFGGLVVVKIIGLWIIVSAITIGLVSIGRKILGIRYLL